jgi:hypothetical protein
MLLALLLAVAELIRRRHRGESSPAAPPEPQMHHL